MTPLGRKKGSTVSSAQASVLSIHEPRCRCLRGSARRSARAQQVPTALQTLAQTTHFTRPSALLLAPSSAQARPPKNSALPSETRSTACSPKKLSGGGPV